MNKKTLLSLMALATAGATYAQTFPGAGTGPIPDRETTGCGEPAGPPLDITFNVSGVFTPLSAVEVDLEVNHTWVGDLDVMLTAPDATEHVLFASTNSVAPTGCGDSSDLGGVYNFTDSAAGGTTWWDEASAGFSTDVMAAGDYQTTTAGDDPSGGAVTSINDAFAAVADPNGTWTLTITDAGGGDTGDVTAANLFLMGGPNPDVIFEDGFDTPPPPPVL